MPSKNRKHFAVVGTDSRVIDSVSSDAKNYLWAIVTPGKKTKWLEEYSEGAQAVYQTDKRLDVGSEDAMRNVPRVHTYDEAGELIASHPVSDVRVNDMGGIEVEVTPEWVEFPPPPSKEDLARYHEAVQTAREKLTELKQQPVSRSDMQTHHDTRLSPKKPAAQRVYKTGQRWTKPGTGIVAKVFLVKDDGRAYARGNRRNLTRILLDESWELV